MSDLRDQTDAWRRRRSERLGRSSLAVILGCGMFVALAAPNLVGCERKHDPDPVSGETIRCEEEDFRFGCTTMTLRSETAVLEVSAEAIHWVQEKSLSHYVPTLRRAMDGDEAALREMMKMGSDFGAASALAHGVALLDLLILHGDDSFSRAAESLDLATRAVARRSLEFGFAYTSSGVHFGSELEAHFPRTAQVLGAD